MYTYKQFDADLKELNTKLDNSLREFDIKRAELNEETNRIKAAASKVNEDFNAMCRDLGL